jgi:hypothetical protein
MLTDWKEKFLAALRETGNVRVSSARAGIAIGTAYRFRKEDAVFAREWASALGAMDWGEDFLDELKITGNIRSACRRTGIASATAHVRRRNNKEFASRWADALASLAWRRTFLEALLEKGNVTQACSRADIDKGTVYIRRANDEQFACDWDAALAGFQKSNIERHGKRPEDWKENFLAGVRIAATIEAGCAKAGVSRSFINNERKRDPAFEREFQYAIDAAIDHAQESAFDRGKLHSDKLLMFILRSHRPEIYREMKDIQHTANIQNGDNSVLTDDERIRRITELLDRARARRDGRAIEPAAPALAAPALAAPAGSADTGVPE